MSGSFDRPSGWPPPPPRHAPDYDPYDTPETGPATSPPPVPGPNHGQSHGPGHGHGQGHGHARGHGADHVALREALPAQSIEPLRRPVVETETHEAIYAPQRGGAKEPEQINAPIVPAGSVTGRSLTLVIAIMCFLACLTAGTVYLIRQSAEAWMRDIASEVTVQVTPQDGADIEKTLRDVVALLQRQNGITTVRPLSLDVATQLLEPWLGKSNALKSLPVPRLIAVEINRETPPNLDEVRRLLEAEFKGTKLDDHRRWQSQIRTVTHSFALGGLAILLLMAAATTAIIVSATKSSMASNREIVEVLHFVGATDRFIAREFEKHFLRLGIRAGLVGAAFAGLIFATIPVLMALLGGSSVTLAEVNRLIGSGSLDMAGYVLLGIVVVVVAALCMLTSRLGVYRILNNKA